MKEEIESSPKLERSGAQSEVAVSAGTVAYPKVLSRLTWMLAATVFPLIWVGGLVTTTDAGMAVPDWPGTYGYNMFAYPVATWLFGPWDLFIEHGHRLLGSLAGIWCIGLVVFACVKSTPRWLLGMTIAALVLVIAQGTLGGVRVLRADREIAKIHGCVGPVFFAFVIALMVMTSQWWRQVGQADFWMKSQQDRGKQAGSGLRWNQVAMFGRLRRTRRLGVAVTFMAYVQLVIGANLRHISDAAPVRQYRILIWFHVLLAVCVGVAIMVLAVQRIGKVKGLTKARIFLVGLIVTQLTLGFGTWVVKFGFPDWFAGYDFANRFLIREKDYLQVQVVTAHVAIGSLILAVSTFVTTRFWRAEHSVRLRLSEGVGRVKSLEVEVRLDGKQYQETREQQTGALKSPQVELTAS